MTISVVRQRLNAGRAKWRAKQLRLERERVASYEIDFLPAHLEVIERPPHPLPRWSLHVLCALVILVVVGAIFFDLDIIAVAPGRLLPAGNVKIIQPAITGVVQRIAVHNGEHVAQGATLVELDPAQASAEAERAKSARRDVLLTFARSQAVLRAERAGKSPILPDVPGAPAQRQIEAQALADGTLLELRHQLAALQAERSRRVEELAATEEEVRKLEATQPLAVQEANDYAGLVEKQYVAAHEYMDKKAAAIQQTQDLQKERRHRAELSASIKQQQAQIEAAISTFRREQLASLDKASADARQLEADEQRAIVRQGLLRITAPVSGVIQNLNIHTVGGVVTTAQPLMEVVPTDNLEVEAAVNNRDIGFVAEGQEATIKVSTFPYTRYGYIKGQVVRVSTDATEDKKQGAVFLARIRIPGNRFRVENRWVTLTPGMDVTAEIKTGRQKVWQYFLAPLLESENESLRER